MQFSTFMRFVKLEHTLFSLPLIFSGAILAAGGKISLRLTGLMLLAAVGARTVALALNRMIDRHLDKQNARTAVRELPAGRMTIMHAWLVLLAGLILYFVSAELIGRFCLLWSPLPLAIFVFYPYMKRFTPLAHFGVGLGLAMAPLAGWVAVTQSLDNLMPGFILGLFTLLWVAGFDIIYATLDEQFDRQANLYSLPAVFGRKRALAISGLLHVLAFLVLLAIFMLYLRTLAAAPLLAGAGFLLYLEHAKANDVELAFFKINAVLGFVVFAMVIVGVSFR
ncbi:4-hydroxybenzoate octaprenyltransferase [candidate division KSB1 bacterium]|nr:MAG: 4-hydroxybenzoate octaprenyltransferase [candidate division KSB1 bacterium]MBC6949972.1 4-hydroxybenzoate octaprenyltransferase [candidate division KSB1 bacterium]MCE7944880.1 4-hydroxybenzoate octaprenyltransferase [Chlorobi bacterium CHB1]MDL1877118.1 4-hydroxybenzoate octaprenyltransferase [Cytophagia bacterium CHB2]